jgi:CHAD domain-containing protein
MPETDPETLPEAPKPRKKKRIEGLAPDLPLAEYARLVMRFHFDELLRHEAGTRLGEDIEELHDMRVAARRLRAAFEIFAPAFRPRAVRPLLRDLREARRALGPVRDLDVFLENASRYQAEHGLNLAPLLEHWQAQREQFRAAMLAYLDGPDFVAFKTDFDQFLNTPGAAARPFDAQEPYPVLTWQAAPLLIYQRYTDILAFEPLLPQATPEQLHDLRIRFKKFRYALEFLRDLLGKPAGAVIDDLKQMQDHLGELHDAHVSCDLLSNQLNDFQRTQANLPLGLRVDLSGVIVYLADLHNRRSSLAETFPAAWAHFNRPEFRRSLALALAE